MLKDIDVLENLSLRELRTKLYPGDMGINFESIEDEDL